MDHMTMREEILKKARSMPQMPMAVQQIMRLMQDENADVGKLSKAIEFDAGLTVNILGIANSPYFGGLRKMNTVREAVVRLGSKKVFQMVLAVGVVPFTKKANKGYGLEPDELTDHSICVALASEMIAKEADITPPPHTFTSGLLVNIGKIVLGDFLEVDADPVLALAHDECISFEAAEQRILGIDHIELGARLLEHWHLPQEVIQVVRHHRHPALAPVKDPALDLVHMGDMLAKMLGIGIGMDGLQYTVDCDVLERVNIKPEMLEMLMPQVIEHMEEIKEALRTA